MAKKTFSAEQIISKLHEAEMLTSHIFPVSYREGKTVEEAYRSLGISGQTYFRWRKVYGGMGTEQAWQTSLTVFS